MKCCVIDVESDQGSLFKAVHISTDPFSFAIMEKIGPFSCLSMTTRHKQEETPANTLVNNHNNEFSLTFCNGEKKQKKQWEAQRVVK